MPNRETPWQDLVRFHRAVVRRADDGFFAFEHADQTGSERWTRLPSLEAGDLTAPFLIPVDSIEHAAFRDEMEAGRLTAVFLGGPCFGAVRGSGTSRTQVWHPIMYRELRVVEAESGLELHPADDQWRLAPPLLDQIERIQIQPSVGPEALAGEIIARAAELQGKEGAPPARAILLALAHLLPEFQARVDEYRRELMHGGAPRWVIFAPPTRVGPINQQLARDYDILGSLVSSSDDGTLGGLRLLEPRAESAPAAAPEVLPFLALNARQEEAVAKALAGAPVTVISGPPGCGKSQMVVSLLLNAWARGHSVLFASNNNKAVEVVRERLAPFDLDLPVAVRAGSPTFNNVASALRRTLQAAAGADIAVRTADLTVIRERRSALREEVARVQGLLDSGMPQQRTEALEAALDLYERHVATCRELATARDVKWSRLGELAGEQLVPGDVGDAGPALRTWILTARGLQDNVHDDGSRRTALTAEIDVARRALSKTLAPLGATEADEADTAWLDRLVAIVRQMDALIIELEASISEGTRIAHEPEWDAVFDAWPDSQSAAAASIAWGLLGGRLETDRSAARSATSAIAAAQAEANARWASLEAAGWPAELREELRLESGGAQAWLTRWKEYFSLPQNSFSPTVFFVKRRIREALSVEEARLRSALPLAVWRTVGILDDDGRDRLATLLDAAARCTAAREQLTAATQRLLALDDALESLRSELRNFGNDLRMLRDDGNAVDSAHAGAVGSATLAHSASVAWRHREERIALIRRVLAAGHGLRMLAATDSIFRAWLDGEGAALASTIDDTAAALSPTRLSALGDLLTSSGVATFRQAIAEAAAVAAPLAERCAERDMIPSVAQRLAGAWSGRPEWMSEASTDQTSWPEYDALNTLADRLDAWFSEWGHFEENDAIKLAGRAHTLADEAQARLCEAARLLPDGSDAEGVRRRVEAITGVDAIWPVEELRTRFDPYTAEQLHAKLESLWSGLSRTALAEGRHAWLHRLSTEPAALEGVARLQKAAGEQGRGDLFNYGADFRAALGATHVWITTAQATRSIPLEPELFDFVVIDEASQCTLTNLLPMIYRARHLVVIGDPEQLTAITVVSGSEQAVLAGQHNVKPYMERLGHDQCNMFDVAQSVLPRKASDVVMLQEHFRSDPLIIGFSNRHVYLQKLVLRRPPGRDLVQGIPAGVHMIQVNAIDVQRPAGSSWVNLAEARAVADRARALVAAGVAPTDIGIVTPFNGQASEIKRQINMAGGLDGLHVSTAFGFQGDERRVMIFSPVAGPGMHVGTLKWMQSPHNLLNVSLTRAKDALFIVGDIAFLKTLNGLLGELASYVSDIQLLRESHRAELELFRWLVMDGMSPRVHKHVGREPVTFLVERGIGRPVAIVVRQQSWSERPETDAERASRRTIDGAGVAFVTALAKDVLETPTVVMAAVCAAANT